MELTKRIKLLKKVYSYNMGTLLLLSPTDPMYTQVGNTITKLHKRIKRKQKLVVKQEEMFRDYTVTYKHGKGQRKAKILATTKGNAEYIFKIKNNHEIISIE